MGDGRRMTEKIESRKVECGKKSKGHGVELAIRKWESGVTLFWILILDCGMIEYKAQGAKQRGRLPCSLVRLLRSRIASVYDGL